jgi:GxxExxY protein
MNNREPEPKLNQLTQSVIGAAIEVHRTLGPGFLESVYEEALAIELKTRRIPFAQQFPVGIQYKGHMVGEGQLDFLIDQQLVLELKAVEVLHPVHTAQILSYLKATRCSLGLLINFNVHVLKQGIRRIAL